MVRMTKNPTIFARVCIKWICATQTREYTRPNRQNGNSKKISDLTHRMSGQRLPTEFEFADVRRHWHFEIHRVRVHYSVTHVVQLGRQTCIKMKNTDLKSQIVKQTIRFVGQFHAYSLRFIIY